MPVSCLTGRHVLNSIVHSRQQSQNPSAVLPRTSQRVQRSTALIVTRAAVMEAPAQGADLASVSRSSIPKHAPLAVQIADACDQNFQLQWFIRCSPILCISNLRCDLTSNHGESANHAGGTRAGFQLLSRPSHPASPSAGADAGGPHQLPGQRHERHGDVPQVMATSDACISCALMPALGTQQPVRSCLIERRCWCPSRHTQ